MKVREPNGPIQVAPPGLLGLLSLKTGGQMPDAMEQSVQPGIDFEQWWLRAKRVVDFTARQSVLVAGAYDNYNDWDVPIVVPETEWWYCHSYSAKVAITDAADVLQSFRLALAWTKIGTQRYRFLGNDQAAFVSAAAGPRYQAMAEGFWMPPGSSLGFYIGGIAGVGGLTSLLRGFEYTVLPV